jgi:methionyl aminopeptidase
VDIGVHVDGYVTDTAVTLCFNPEYRKPCRNSGTSPKGSHRNIHPEMPTSKLGAIIEKTIKSQGL